MTAPALTESIVFDLLRQYHTKTGNGGAGEYALLAGVRNAAGFEASRTFDAVLVNLWPSRGLSITVYETKVSRSDWLRELKDPAKADDAAKVADYFTVVAPVGCVKDGEMPDPWGLVTISGDGAEKPWKVRVARSPKKLHDADTRTRGVSRGLLVAMLRSCPGAIPGGRVPAATALQLSEARAEGEKLGKARAESAQRSYEATRERQAREWDELQEALTAAGVPYPSASRLRQIAPAIAAALAGENTGAQLDGIRRQLSAALVALGGESGFGLSAEACEAVER